MLGMHVVTLLHIRTKGRLVYKSFHLQQEASTGDVSPLPEDADHVAHDEALYPSDGGLRLSPGVFQGSSDDEGDTELYFWRPDAIPTEYLTEELLSGLLGEGPWQKFCTLRDLHHLWGLRNELSKYVKSCCVFV